MDTNTFLPILFLLSIVILLISVSVWLWRKSAQPELSEAELLLSTLTHNINNELQNLISVLGNTKEEIITGNGRFPSSLQDNFTLISDGLNDIEDIIANATVFRKQQPSQKKPVNIVGVAQSVIIKLHNRAEKLNVDLRYDGPDSAPPVWGTETACKQVLLNLIGNGIKFRKPDSEESVVIVKVGTKRGKVVIEITDNGKGMTEEKRRQLLISPFQPRTAQTTRIEGTGLGVYASNEMIKKMQGTLRIESEPGYGTTITIALPIAKRASPSFMGKHI